MKLYIAILITCFAFLTVLNSFDFNNKGFKLGLNYSNLTHQDKIDTSFTPNITFGCFLSSGITNRIYFQPELKFVMKRIKADGRVAQYIDNDDDGFVDEDHFDLLDNDGDGLIDEDTTEFFINDNVNLNSISVETSFLMKFILRESKDRKFFVLFGPSLSYFLENSLDPQNNFYHKGEESDDRFDVSGLLGFEYQINKLLFEINFTQSIINNNLEYKTDYTQFEDFNKEIFPKFSYSKIESKYSTISFLIGFQL